MTQRSAGNYLRDSGFKLKEVKVGDRKPKKTVAPSYTEMEFLLWNWVSEHQNNGIIKRYYNQRSKLCSIDFTFTSHRTSKRTSFGASGAGRVHGDKELSRYTNCIVTILWADGTFTPSYLFTANRELVPKTAHTKKDKPRQAHLAALFSEFNMDKSRVIYANIGKRTYATECPEFVEKVLELHPPPDGAAAFSDNGTSLMKDGEPILKTKGYFAEYDTYPAVVHHALSPNDNLLHGTAKARWKGLVHDWSDDARASIMLLSLLDEEAKKYGKHWWERNLLNLTSAGVKPLLHDIPMEKLFKLEKRKELYQKWLEEQNGVEGVTSGGC